MLLAAHRDKPEVWLLLIAKGADLRVRYGFNHSALSHYSVNGSPRSLSGMKLAMRRTRQILPSTLLCRRARRCSSVAVGSLGSLASVGSAVASSWAFIAAVSRSPQPVAALIRGQRFAQFSSLRRCTCEGWQPARKAA